MRTRNYFKYLLATLALFGNVSLGMAQSSAPTWSWKRGTTQGTDVWYKNNSANLESVRIGDMSDSEYWNDGIGFGLTTPQSGELTRINSTKKSNMYRAAVEELKLSVVVPSYTKATYSAEFATYSVATDGRYTKHGCNLFCWGNGLNNKTNAYNRSFTTLEKKPETTNYYICGNYQGNNGVSESNYTKKEISFDNSTNGSEQNLDAYFAVLAYIRNVGGSLDKNVEFAVKYRNESVSYKYYANITFHDLNGNTSVQSCSAIGDNAVTMQGINPGNISGYQYVGWSRIPNATEPEFDINGNGRNFTFSPHDKVNGGGYGSIDLYPVWVNTTTINFDLQGGWYEGQLVSVMAMNGYDMPLEGHPDAYNTVALGIPKSNDGPFAGYYDQPGGQGTQYYKCEDGQIKSARKWDKTDATATLYAYWKSASTGDTGGDNGNTGGNAGGNNTYTVTLDAQGGTGGSTTVTATYGEKLPSGLTAPVKLGYEFKGFYSSQNQEYAESMGQDYGGTQYYDKDMVGVNNWNLNYNATIYAHWKPKKFIVTLDGTTSAVVPKQMQYDSEKAISDVVYNSEGVVKISFTYGEQCPSQITNGKFKKAGFKLLGFYDSKNVLVATVKLDNPTDRNIYFNETSGYWTRKNGNLVWNCTHDVNLTARYEAKYTVKDDNIIDFGTEYLEVGIDWENSMVHDLLGAAEAEYAAGRISSTNPVMVFDIRNANYLDGSSKKSDDLMVPLKDKEFISPNVLVYLGEGAYDVIDNEITTDGKCPGLVVTDRCPIKIPYGFTASTATYERNKAFINDDNDAMWQQSKDSKWGTLCLPYPIKNNQKYDKNGVKYTIRFYELHNTYGNGQGQEYMQFYEMDADQEIAANTPVLYCRTEGSAGSDITVKATNVEVHANAGYGTNLVDYKEKVDRKEAEESVMYWKFVGTLQTKEYCGAEYNGRVADGVYQNIDNKMGATFIDHNKMEIYFFESDKFKKLSRKGKIILYPYRAFFEDHTITYLEQSGESKVSSYSILVVDADGTTTDITNLVGNSNAKGDGKIYDLSGRRVKQPVKGSIYIVDGKKKMY